MPYINLKTTKKVTDEKCVAIKTAFGKAIECFPGKNEAYLMVCIEDEKKLWFAGDDSKDSAVVDVQLLGAVNPSASNDMTAEIRKHFTLPCSCFCYIGNNDGIYFSDCYIPFKN